MLQVGDLAVALRLDDSKYKAGLDEAKKTGTSVASAIENSFNKADIGKGLSASLSSAKGDFTKIGEELGNSLTNQMQSSLGPLGGIAASAASALGPIGIAAGLAGAAIVGIGASSVGVAANFQSSMSRVNAVLGGSQEDFNALSQAARDAGATTQFSASQAADALYYLASAGLSSTDATTALKDVLNLAGAGGMDLAQASDMLTATLAQYSLKAEEAGRVTNVIAATAAMANTDVSQMGQALTTVGAYANAFGISIEATSAALGILSNGGIKGAEAGTMLRGVLSGLAVQSGPASEALAAIGLTAEDINPATHTLSEIFTTLKEHGMDATTALQLFGRENVSAAMYLQDHAKELDTLQTKITGTNKAAEMNAQLNDNLKGAYAELSSAIEEAQISIGNLFLPALTSITRGATEVIGGITTLGHTLYSLAKNSEAVSAISQAFSKLGDAGKEAFGAISAVVGPAWTAIGGGSAVMSALQAAFNAATIPITAFFTVLGKVADGVKALATAVAPAATAIGETLGGAIKTADAYIQAIIESITNLVSNSSTVQTLVSAFGALQTKLSEIATFWGDVASKVISGLTEAIPKALSSLISSVASAFGQTGQAASDAFTNAIKSSPVGAIFGFAEGISARANQILAAGDKAAEKVAEGVEKNEALAKAPGNALQSDKALAGAEAAGEKLADKTLSAFAKQAQASNLSDTALLSIINSQSSYQKIKEKVYDLYGTTIKYWYDAAEKYPTAYLEIDGVQVSQAYDKTKGKATVEDLLRQLGLDEDVISHVVTQKTAKINSLLSKTLQEHQKTIDKSSLWDKANTQRNWIKWTNDNADAVKRSGDQLSLEFYNAMNELGNASSEAVQGWADKTGISFESAQATLSDDLQNVLKAIADPGSIPPDILNQSLADLIDAGVIGPQWREQIEEAGTQIVEGFEIPIANAGEWAKSELSKMAKEASDAWKEGLTQEEADAIAAFEPELEYIKTNFPDLFEQYGGEAMLRLIKAIKANGGDVEAAMKQIGKDSGKAFSDSLLDGVKKSPSLKEIANAIALGPDKLKELIANPYAYAWTDGIDQAKSILNAERDNITHGIIDPAAARQDIISAFEPIHAVLPDWFNNLNTLLKNNRITLSQYYAYFDNYMSQTEKLRESTDKLSSSSTKGTGCINSYANACSFLGLTADSSTAKLEAMGLAIDPLAEISGRGISVSFSPAQVIADRAYNQLIQASNVVKYTTDEFGRRIAVIGQVAQQNAERGGAALYNGAVAGASAIASAAQSFSARLYGGSTWLYGIGSTRFYAEGTRTSGPELAVIGEDGPTYPEFILPTRTKRWDLLYQAMRAYGIRGFAEGGSTGDVATGDGSNVIVTFGIPGIASAAKTIKRTLTDLQNYFRTTWTLIKSDAQVYWKAISTNLTTDLNSISGNISFAAMGWRATLKTQMAGLSSEQLQAWTQIADQAKTSLQSITDYISQNNYDMAQSVSQGLNDISNALNSFSGNWQSIWNDATTSFQQQAQTISTKIQEIVSQLSALGSMSVNPSVNLNVSSYDGGGGGYGDYGGWSPNGGGGDWLSCGDITIGGSGNVSVGGTSGGSSVCGPSYMSQVIASTGSSATAGLGVTSGSSGGGIYVPAIIAAGGNPWAAKGADIQQHELIHVGEKGPELILPTNIRNTILGLAELGLDRVRGNDSQPLVVKLYLDGKEISNVIMKRATSSMRAKGLSLA